VKQFLRYQIYGTVLILWVVVFFYGKDTNNLSELFISLYADLKDLTVLAGLATAMPIGVILHQFSVLIKNCLIAKIWVEFDDFPQKETILKLNVSTKEKATQYCLERISNLNSFYYVRFDNGFLSPFLAWLVVYFFMGRSINCPWLLSALFIGVLTMIYLRNIYYEIKEYRRILSE